MAEALLSHLGGDRYLSFSAGSHPTGVVNPLALETLRSHGIEFASARSKSWDEFEDGEPIDLVVTVCAQAAAQSCPVWPNQPKNEHWEISDPAAAEGSKTERRAAFETAFGKLKRLISQLLNRA